jgi:IS1 family transposase
MPQIPQSPDEQLPQAQVAVSSERLIERSNSNLRSHLGQ